MQVAIEQKFKLPSPCASAKAPCSAVALQRRVSTRGWRGAGGEVSNTAMVIFALRFNVITLPNFPNNNLNKAMKTDLLAIGAHPDDVELSAGGTIALHVKAGKVVGIIDLTRGELGTRGNADLRDQESKEASGILGIAFRENLKMKDGLFENDEQHLLKIIEKIRLYQPEVVICNAVTDRHPDHGRASTIVSRACFLSGLRKINTQFNNKAQELWRPKAVYHYIQDRHIQPDFIIDISRFMDVKMAAIKAYSSQFYDPDSKEPETPISGKGFLEFLYGRAVEMGRMIDVAYGEGFTVERSIGLKSIFDIS